jgi:bifunctional non-homologous end joining protein LigD
LDAEPHKVLLFAFDLLHLDGKDVRREPLEERRARLQALLKPDPLTGIQFSEAIEGDGRAIFAEAEKMGLEGSSQSGLAAATRAVPRATG